MNECAVNIRSKVEKHCLSPTTSVRESRRHNACVYAAQDLLYRKEKDKVQLPLY